MMPDHQEPGAGGKTTPQPQKRDWLLSVQDVCGGAIPVERFIREALYHPDYGYYSNNIRTVGRRGDFSTSASLGQVLGMAIAGWIRARWAGGGPRRHVIEVGAGTGAMAHTVLREFGFFSRLGLSYHIVETSPILRKEQQSLLGRRAATWHESVAGALAAAGGEAMIFSNELIDAFPCRVFEKADGKWLEVALRIEGNLLGEVLLDAELPTAASALTQDFPDGQRIEVHAAAAEWMASWAGHARHVEILTIDYGDVVEQLYYRRPRGTLRAYFHQQRFDGGAVFQRFGKQDITADVNFTDLERWGEILGWETVLLESQGQFIRKYVSDAGIAKSPADMALADLSGAGDAFRVLHQRIDRRA